MFTHNELDFRPGSLGELEVWAVDPRYESPFVAGFVEWCVSEWVFRPSTLSQFDLCAAELEQILAVLRSKNAAPGKD